MQTLVENIRKPDITFRSDGSIIISASIAKRLSLMPGDAINVVPDSNEYFLVARHASRDTQGKPIASFRNAVHYIKGEHGTMRCSFRKLCNAINFITQSPASVLFCGTPRENFRGFDIAIPIITANNQYNK